MMTVQEHMIDCVRVGGTRNIQLLRQLLDSNVNPNFELYNPICNKIPIFEAILHPNIDIIKILLFHNPQNSSNVKMYRHDYNGFETVLCIVSRILSPKSIEILKLLLDNGANPDEGRFNYSITHPKSIYSSYTPLEQLCMIMHDYSYDEDHSYYNEYYIVQYNKLKILLKYGAKVSLKSLLSVVKKRCYEFVKLLLEYDADPFEKDHHGKDAFDYTDTEQMINILKNNKYLKSWQNIMRQESENGIIYEIKYHPNNFHVWKNELHPDNILLKYW